LPVRLVFFEDAMQPCNVLLVAPSFPTNTFWSLKAACAVAGARHPQPPLGLITVAAMLPAHWTSRLIDCNVSELTDADLEWADVVMTGGMLAQRADCFAVMERAQRLSKPVVVGGPDVMSQPDAYAKADFVVIGEAESILPQWVAAWNEGRRRGTFKAEKFKADVTTTPAPRFDLLRREDYVHYSVQFSRGCPFTCEFCDIIEIYGRVPRVKTIAQFLGELDALYDTGYRGQLDFVDDNFIGNKKAVKQLLPELIQWQRKRHYPFWFTTEASLNLADDPDLLALMRRANFGGVFIGIESPDSDTLVATRKKQNTRRNIAESVHRVQEAGMLVVAGFIIGFDTERGSVSSAMLECIQDAAIPVCTAGLLVALHNTQLYRRLEREGRLHPWNPLVDLHSVRGGDHCTTLGLNFETKRPRRDMLVDYKRVIETLYSPRAYFARVKDVAVRIGRWPAHGMPPQRPARWTFLGTDDMGWTVIGRLLRGAIRVGPLTFLHVLMVMAWAARTDARRLHAVVLLAAAYLHLGPFSRTVSAVTSRQIGAIDSGEWESPLPAPVSSTPASSNVRTDEARAA
jgi:hypothetical protein